MKTVKRMDIAVQQYAHAVFYLIWQACWKRIFGILDVSNDGPRIYRPLASFFPKANNGQTSVLRRVGSVYTRNTGMQA